MPAGVSPSPSSDRGLIWSRDLRPPCQKRADYLRGGFYGSLADLLGGEAAYGVLDEGERVVWDSAEDRHRLGARFKWLRADGYRRNSEAFELH